jgi:hypothetical protein
VTFIWILIQITQVIQIIQLLWTILHGVFFFDDLLKHGNGRRCWGCDGVPFIVIILILVIVILSYPGTNKQNRSLYTCAQDVKIKCIATI